MTTQEMLTSFVWIACVAFLFVVFYLRILAELEFARQTRSTNMLTKTVDLVKKYPYIAAAIVLVVIGFLILLGGDSEIIRHPEVG